MTFGFFPPASLGPLPRLKFVQLLTAGSEHATTMLPPPLTTLSAPSSSSAAIRLATCSGLAAPAIAQYVAMQLLTHAGGFVRLLEFEGQRKWAGLGAPGGISKGLETRVLAGARVGILGYGMIGRQGRLSSGAKQRERFVLRAAN